MADHTHAWAQDSLDRLTSLPGVRRAGVALMEGGGRQLNFTSAHRPGEEPAAWCQLDAYDDVPLNTAVRSGRAVVGSLGRLSRTHPAFVERQEGTGTRALAAVPLVSGGRTLGAYVVFYSTVPAFRDDEVAALSDLGASLGATLGEAQAHHLRTPGAAVRTAEPGSLVEEFWVPGDPAAVGPARRRLRDTLLLWEVDAESTGTAVLCMSELVTNAVVHSGSGCWVEVLNESAAITVAVRSAWSPQSVAEVGASDLMQVHGRGLQLVAELSARWGSEPDDDGLTAWFVLEA
jgi:GAF domain-containing protein